MANLASGHEFWISPPDYTISQSEPLLADIRVGENFSGNAYSWFEGNFTRFDVTDAGQTWPVTGRLGDFPALNAPPRVPGLQIVAYVSTPSTLTWAQAQDFDAFVDMHGLDWVRESHASRGLPARGFSEAFTRHAKSLMTVDIPDGADRILGLRAELVTLANPYADDLSAGLPVLALFEGQPLARHQIEMFRRTADGNVSRSVYLTGPDGIVTLPDPGTDEVLVNTVVMIEPGPDEGGTHIWHSHWASLTFAVDPPGGGAP